MERISCKFSLFFDQKKFIIYVSNSLFWASSSYYQVNNQFSLSQQDLINSQGTNSTARKNPNPNNKLLIGLGLGVGGALIVGAVIGILVRKQKLKKSISCQ